MAGVHVFDSSIEDGNVWLKAVMEHMGSDDPQVAHMTLRAALHALRDRIPPESAVHLGAQLPTIIRGIFYEGWHMAGTPTKERHLEPFLDHVKQDVSARVDLDLEVGVRAVFAAIFEHIDPGEVAKVMRLLPQEIRELWPPPAQV